MTKVFRSFLYLLTVVLRFAHAGEPWKNYTTETGVIHLRLDSMSPRVLAIPGVPKLSGVSIELSPTFWAVYGSFYFCIASTTAADVLEKHFGVEFVLGKYDYSFFKLVNFTLLDTSVPRMDAETTLYHSYDPTAILPERDNKPRPTPPRFSTANYRKPMIKRYCYTPELASLTHWIHKKNQWMLYPELITGLHHFRPIKNAILTFGGIQRVDLQVRPTSTVWNSPAPIHVVETPKNNNKYTYQTTTTPTSVRVLRPYCCKIPFKPEVCFTYIYAAVGPSHGVFALGVTLASIPLELPSAGVESAFTLVNHDQLKLSVKKPKRKTINNKATMDVIGFCTLNREVSKPGTNALVKAQAIRDYRPWEVDQAQPLEATVSENFDYHPMDCASPQLDSYVQDVFYVVKPTATGSSTVIDYVDVARHRTTYKNSPVGLGLECALIRLRDENDQASPKQTTKSQPSNVLQSSGDHDVVTVQVSKPSGPLSILIVSHAVPVVQTIPPEGYAVALTQSSSRFIAAEFHQACYPTTRIDVEDPVEGSKYVEINNKNILRNKQNTGSSCYRILGPTNGTHNPAKRLEVYVYQPGNPRPELSRAPAVPVMNLLYFLFVTTSAYFALL